MIDLQTFSEKSIEHQTNNALRKGIRNLQKMIEIHQAKIENPQSFYPRWDSMSEFEKLGNIRHWQKEIKNFEESIQNRLDELNKRGDTL